MLSDNFSNAVRIADIGCGDGFFTMEIAEKFRPSAIRGIEPAANAVEVARTRIPAHLARSVSFQTGNIYDLENDGVEVAVIRGVLHHLDRRKRRSHILGGAFTRLLRWSRTASIRR